MKRRRSHSHGASQRSLKPLWISLIVFAAVLAAVFLIGRSIEQSGKTDAFGSLEGRFEETPTVTYQGKKYAAKQKLETFLFIGVDKQEDQQEDDVTARNGGQCDFLMLMVFDHAAKTLQRIQIDRDTMAEITVLGILGNALGTNTHQICLAHGFGDGKEQSCRFTVEAVRRLMEGITIDGYVALNMGGINTLNDLLGGVTVTLSDDFSMYDPAMIPGVTLTLRGQQAETYVRTRMGVSDGTNASRMLRQQDYLDKAANILIGRLKDEASFANKLFDGMADYIVTETSRGKLINVANKVSAYTIDAPQSLTGEHTIGSDGFVEFHADPEALTQLVLDIFYQPAA